MYQETWGLGWQMTEQMLVHLLQHHPPLAGKPLGRAVSVKSIHEKGAKC